MLRSLITSRQLEYFRAVGRELHFTRAARSLRIAQPALSQHIRNLERQLGLLLFERDRRHVALTPAGATLLAHAERILSDLATVDDEMRDWGGGMRGRIRLGMARGVAAQMADVLARFAADRPAVEVELREETTDEMVADLRAGRLDVATLAALPAAGVDALRHHVIGREPLVAATALTDPLANRKRIALRELAGVDMVLYGPGSAIRELILAALEAEGIAPTVRFETREYRTARILASAGLAVALLPRSVAEEPGHRVAILCLEPEPSWAPVVAWSSQRRPAPAVAAFLEFIAAPGDGLSLDGVAGA